jgi:phosphoribosylanthranilate isomerase
VGHQLRIKICGITNAEDARQAALLGADAIGLNFCLQSPRCVQQDQIISILRVLPPFVESVGVFVSPIAAEMCSAAATHGFSLVQRHCVEHEPVDVSPYRLIDAFQVPGRHSLDYIRSYLQSATERRLLPAAIVIDGSTPGQFGGTGKTAPWNLLADFKPGMPLILAGGLTPENVAEAVRIVRPYAVDVASGVESSPGRKDVEKMKRFIDNARSAAG